MEGLRPSSFFLGTAPDVTAQLTSPGTRAGLSIVTVPCPWTRAWRQRRHAACSICPPLPPSLGPCFGPFGLPSPAPIMQMDTSTLLPQGPCTRHSAASFSQPPWSSLLLRTPAQPLSWVPASSGKSAPVWLSYSEVSLVPSVTVDMSCVFMHLPSVSVSLSHGQLPASLDGGTGAPWAPADEQPWKSVYHPPWTEESSKAQRGETCSESLESSKAQSGETCSESLAMRPEAGLNPAAPASSHSAHIASCVPASPPVWASLWTDTQGTVAAASAGPSSKEGAACLQAPSGSHCSAGGTVPPPDSEGPPTPIQPVGP